MKLTKFNLLTLLLCGTMLWSCKKDEEVNATDNVVEVQIDAEAEFNDLDDFAIDFMAINDATLFPPTREGAEVAERNIRFRNCADVTIDTELRRIEVDFGANAQNQPCNDGRIRRGKIIITYTGRYRTPGSTITITPEDYSVRNANTQFVQVAGTKTITNTTPDTEGAAPAHNVVVTGGRLTYADGTFATWTRNNTRTQTAGANTPFILLDDIYEITGSYSGTNRRGESYTATISQALQINFSCRLQRGFRPVRGVLNIEAPQRTISINYGNGNCGDAIGFTITPR
jgi:hypothetical protein